MAGKTEVQEVDHHFLAVLVGDVADHESGLLLQVDFAGVDHEFGNVGDLVFVAHAALPLGLKGALLLAELLYEVAVHVLEVEVLLEGEELLLGRFLGLLRNDLFDLPCAELPRRGGGVLRLDDGEVGTLLPERVPEFLAFLLLQTLLRADGPELLVDHGGLQQVAAGVDLLLLGEGVNFWSHGQRDRDVEDLRESLVGVFAAEALPLRLLLFDLAKLGQIFLGLLQNSLLVEKL